jgi:tRNA-specific 2-thiouridylase
VDNRATVVVALSGGVDSSTAAALLVERGYHVIGMMMRLWSEPPPLSLSPSYGGGARDGHNRCCSPESVADARAVCAQLGIPFYLLNFEIEFKTRVVDYMIDGYARGVTPNPCVECNRAVKFGALLDKARAFGADYVATGHYARVRERAGKFELLRGVDPEKDQSYALCLLSQAQLARTLFPLGEFTKDQTREVARRFNLRVAARAESQDLCFVADGDYRGFLRRHAPSTLVSGDIVDRRNRVLGRHAGLANYTIGQRKGLGLAVGEPLFVVELDTARNRLIIGRADELGKRELIAAMVNWITGAPPRGETRVTAKIRYRAIESRARVMPREGERVRVIFDQPLRDIAPGQAVVFYDGEVCLGGGLIQASSPSGDRAPVGGLPD